MEDQQKGMPVTVRRCITKVMRDATASAYRVSYRF